MGMHTSALAVVARSKRSIFDLDKMQQAVSKGQSLFLFE